MTAFFLFLVSLSVVVFFAIDDSWEGDDLVMFQVLKKGQDLPRCDFTDFPMTLQLTLHQNEHGKV